MGRAKLTIYVFLLLNMFLSVSYAEENNTSNTNSNVSTVVAPPKPALPSVENSTVTEDSNANSKSNAPILFNKTINTKNIIVDDSTAKSANNSNASTNNTANNNGSVNNSSSNTSNTSALGISNTGVISSQSSSYNENSNAPLISNEDAKALEQNTEVGTEDLRDEIVNLRNELQQLNRSIEEYHQRNVDLQQKLDEYKKQEMADGSLFKLQFLRTAVLDPIFSNPVLKDPNYSEAVLDIVYGEITPAEKNLTTFLLEDINVEDHLKDASTISADYDVRLSALKADLQLRQDSANFLLGYTKLLLFKPQESIEYFAKSYNNTQNFNLVLLNLVALVDAFTAVGRTQEACDTIKRYYTNIAQSKGSNKPLPAYLTLEVEEKIATTKQAINCK